MSEVMLANGAVPAEPTRADDGSGLDPSVFMDFLPQGVRIIDRHYRIVRINRSFSELSGVSQKGATSKKYFEIFKSENLSGIGLGLALPKCWSNFTAAGCSLRANRAKEAPSDFRFPSSKPQRIEDEEFTGIPAH